MVRCRLHSLLLAAAPQSDRKSHHRHGNDDPAQGQRPSRFELAWSAVRPSRHGDRNLCQLRGSRNRQGSGGLGCRRSQLGVVFGFLVGIQQTHSRRRDLPQDLLRLVRVLADLIRPHVDDPLFRRVGNHVRIRLEQRHAQQPIMIRRLLRRRNFRPARALITAGQARVRPILITAITTLGAGLFLMMSRTKAITQVIGYLMLENGIYLVGTALTKQSHTRYVVEFGVLLDVLVGVMIMGIILNNINRAFDDVDTALLGRLKD